jgi:subtilisin family serine protease
MFAKKVSSLVSAAALVSAIAVIPASPSVAASGKAGKPAPSNSVYIVRMADAPAVAYDGKIKGYAATRPAKGGKIDLDDANVGRYVAHLSAKHDSMLQKAGGGRKLYSYGYAFNGFAAELSAGQAAKLRATPGVLSVAKDAVRQLDTSTTPTFLGLSGAGGFYAVHGVTGENVVIGVIDGGVWPENLSFSDRVDANGNPTGKKGTLAYQPVAGWNGKCTSGEQFSQDHCNTKLIGARFYNAGWGGNSQINRLFPFEFVSPRDWDGHGTHTSSTAGGNRNVPATGALTSAFGNVNGIAPRARLAVYKVCWADQPRGGGCFNSDSVAAIDQAVADGVDVINFSVSGSQTSFLDPVEVAFLFAADAGVFVATSAGNAGLDSAVAHPGPWVTTVAAGTHNRNGEGSVTLGNAAIHAGASYANALGSRPLIDSTAAGLAGANASLVEFCAPTVLDPTKVAGKIVLCKRGGGIALVDKSGAVAAAGGAGAIIYNDPAAGAATSILALLHPVPAVHVLAANGVAIKGYIAGAGASATASIAQSSIVLNVDAPFTASFSSRGPLQAGGGDLLKPDVIAPGQDILAAVAPPDNGGRSFDLYSGTSMSSPHVAGLAALFKELHPGWSPMAIKSALMTSAGDILELPNTDARAIFRQGAGHVQPGLAANPGLVFDHAFSDWLAFLCGTGQLTGAGCAAIAIDPSDLNVPSIAIGDLPGIQTVTRRVTNVGTASATYTPVVTGLEGFSVGINPATLVVPAGETRPFTVTISRLDAELDSYTGGQLTWSDGSSTNVRIPIVVRPIVISAPPQVAGTGGAIAYNVKFGYSGDFEASPRGLVPAIITAGTVADDPTNGTCSLTSPNAQLIAVNVPAGTAHARFSLFDADVNAGSDLDICVFEGATQVGASTSGTSAEEVNLVNPEAANYTVVVHGWGVVGSSPFKLHAWVLPDSDAGNMTVTAPTTAVAGTSASITLDFSGLSPGIRYLGAVAYSDGIAEFGRTLVRVDSP